MKEGEAEPGNEVEKEDADGDTYQDANHNQRYYFARQIEWRKRARGGRRVVI